MNKISITLALALASIPTTYSSAASYTFWHSYNFQQPVFTTPEEGCEYLYSDNWWPHLKDRYMPSMNKFETASHYICAMSYSGGGFKHYFGDIYKETINCENGTALDYNSRQCSLIGQKGNPDDSLSCDAPSPKQGNPINSATGNKFQEDTDFNSPTFSFSRSFNSLDGLWRHSLSNHLYFTSHGTMLVNADGSEHLFSGESNTLTSATSLGTIEKHDSHFEYYAINGETLKFTTSGKLLSTSKRNGQELELSRSGETVSIKEHGVEIGRLTEDRLYQPKSFSTEGLQLTYTYNSNRLISVSKITSGQTRTRTYHYEVNGKPNLLTGITDERGVRYATWSYDDKGRAISSEHANGANKVLVSYNTDGSSTVTNELGKKTTYQFQLIQGVKHITAISGEPSANCPNSNSSFTYDERGLLKTKTDNKGVVTTYDYNSRGLEVSRTEASGTAQARTITTEWHPTLFLPLTVTEPGRVTTYTYDSQGRQLSQTSTAL